MLSDWYRKMDQPQRRKAAAWVALCVGCVSGAEGLHQYAYRDPVGIPTICFGETKGVRMGDTKTVSECRAMLSDDLLADYGPAVDKCITHPLPPGRKAAYTSAAYNLGAGAFCKSRMARLENADDFAAACNALLLYNRAHGVVLPGLTARRETERKLCLESSP